jgi:hypothetical protein
MARVHASGVMDLRHRTPHRATRRGGHAPHGPGGTAPAPPVAAPAAGGTDATIEALTQLGELKAQGVLTEAEFEAQKARLLGG